MTNIQSIVDLLAIVYSTYVSVTANGAKLTWLSVFKLGPVLQPLMTAVNNSKAALAEFEALTPDQNVQLEAYIATKLPGADAGTVKKILAGVDLLLLAGSGVKDVMVLIGKSVEAAAPTVAAPVPAAPAAQ